MILKKVRCDWVFLAETNQHGGYSLCAMIPDSHPQMAEVRKEIEKAKAKGISGGKFTEANTKSANFKNPLHNGTEEAASEERPAVYKGHHYVNANQKGGQLGVVGPNLQPLMDDSCLYSGAFYNIEIAFDPFNTKSKGVGCGLNNVMFVEHGDRLDGRQNAEAAFAGMGVADGGEGEGEGDLQ